MTPSTAAAGRRIASIRHTAIVTVVLLIVAVAGIVSRLGAGAPIAAPSNSSHVSVYISLTLMEWALVLLVARGIAPAGLRVRDLIADSSFDARALVRDVVLAAFMWACWSAIAYAWSHWYTSPLGNRVQSMLPHGALESVLWIALSCSAGFAEELLCRGYLQSQFAALTGSASLAVVIQAVLLLLRTPIRAWARACASPCLAFCLVRWRRGGGRCVRE